MEQRIRELAYLRWEQAGSPPSDGVSFWLQAEEELLYENLAKPQPRRKAAKPASKSRD